MPTVYAVPKNYGWRNYWTNPAAAARLSGLGALGDIVPNGAIVVYQGVWPASSSFPKNILENVSSALQGDGLSVLSSSSGSGLISDVAAKPYNVSLQIQVNNGMGFGQPADIASIVDHEFYASEGAMPLSSAITQVSAASPAAAAAAVGNPAALPSAQPQDWSTWLQDNALWIGLGIAAVVIAPRFL